MRWNNDGDTVRNRLRRFMFRKMMKTRKCKEPPIFMAQNHFVLNLNVVHLIASSINFRFNIFAIDKEIYLNFAAANTKKAHFVMINSIHLMFRLFFLFCSAVHRFVGAAVLVDDDTNDNNLLKYFKYLSKQITCTWTNAEYGEKKKLFAMYISTYGPANWIRFLPDESMGCILKNRRRNDEED